MLLGLFVCWFPLLYGSAAITLISFCTVYTSIIRLTGACLTFVNENPLTEHMNKTELHSHNTNNFLQVSLRLYFNPNPSNTIQYYE